MSETTNESTFLNFLKIEQEKRKDLQKLSNSIAGALVSVGRGVVVAHKNIPEGTLPSFRSQVEMKTRDYVREISNLINQIAINEELPLQQEQNLRALSSSVLDNSRNGDTAFVTREINDLREIISFIQPRSTLAPQYQPSITTSNVIRTENTTHRAIDIHREIIERPSQQTRIVQRDSIIERPSQQTRVVHRQRIESKTPESRIVGRRVLEGRTPESRVVRISVSPKHEMRRDYSKDIIKPALKSPIQVSTPKTQVRTFRQGFSGVSKRIDLSPLDTLNTRNTQSAVKVSPFKTRVSTTREASPAKKSPGKGEQRNVVLPRNIPILPPNSEELKANYSNLPILKLAPHIPKLIFKVGQSEDKIVLAQIAEPEQSPNKKRQILRSLSPTKKIEALVHIPARQSPRVHSPEPVI